MTTGPRFLGEHAKSRNALTRNSLLASMQSEELSALESLTSELNPGMSVLPSAVKKPRRLGKALRPSALTSARKTSKKSGKKKRKRSTAETLLETVLAAEGFSGWVTEHKFHKTRKWRFDFAWPDLKIAVEVEGGAFIRGRHMRPSGFIADCEKYSVAAIEGWTVIRVVPRRDWIPEAIDLISQALISRGIECLK